MTGFLFFDELKEDILKIMDSVSFFESKVTIEYKIFNRKLSFPYRIYSDDISDDFMSQFTTNQQKILHCIYSRHSNGFVREKHIKALFLSEIDFLTVPYIFKVCDEYILEIIEIVYSNLKQRNNEDFILFCEQNKICFFKSYSRMISYWNEYYRDKYPNFNVYIGKKLFEECFGFSSNKTS